MKKQWIVGVIALLVVVLAVWFFWPKDQSAHVRVVPADATALMELDLEGFLQESELSEEKIKTLLPEHMDVWNSGIDWEKHAYVFVDAVGMNGCLLAVKDAGELKEFLAQNGELMGITPVEEQQGYYWSLVSGSFVLGFDDDVLMIMGPTLASAQAEMRQRMLGYLKQDKSESVLKAPLYKKMQEQDGVLKAAVSLEMFPEYYRMFQNLGLPEHVDFSKMLMTLSIESKKGQIVFHTGVLSEDPALAQKMKALDDLSGQIDGDFLTSVSPNTTLWMGANLKGDKLMQLMSEIPPLRLYLMAMNHVMDVERMIRSIDGDVALSGTVDGEPVVCVQAHMSDLSFMDDADYWISSARASGNYEFERVDEDLYRIGKVAPQDLFLGLKDRNVLFTTSRSAMNGLQKGMDSDLLKPYEDDIRESKFYVWGNLGAVNGVIRSMGLSEQNPQVQQVERFFGKFKAVALRSTKATSMDLIFYLKNKESGLKQLFE